MISCLYFIQSNKEYRILMSFLSDNSPKVSGIFYLVFNKNIKITDGRTFHTSNGYLVAVSFLSYFSDIKREIVGVGLNIDSITDLHEIVCVDENPQTKGLTIIESAEYIDLDKKLEGFLKDRDFKFSDGSTLII